MSVYYSTYGTSEVLLMVNLYSTNQRAPTPNGDSDEGDRGSGLMVISVPGSL
jgi:hypothetical protein